MSYNFANTGLSLPLWLLLCGSFSVSFLITLISTPVIVKVSLLKNLFDIPNERASHNSSIPVLGGLSIFAGFSLSAIIFSFYTDTGEVHYLIGALIVLFFTGLKDDILVIDPMKKLWSQIIAAFIIVILGDIRITNFHSVFGIEDISYLTSILFTIFLVVLLINSFNLIDGIDGLAAAIGILISLFFGVWFFLSGHYTFVVLCLALMGSLIAFFIFNVRQGKNKIFMGDTGSMVMGLIISVLTIRFLEFENKADPDIQFYAAPALAFGLLIIPLFDTLRVFIIRLLNGNSPFKADKIHIHHKLLKIGFSHLQVTYILILLNLCFLCFVYLFQEVGSVYLIIIITCMAFILSLWLDFRLKQKNL